MDPLLPKDPYGTKSYLEVMKEVSKASQEPKFRLEISQNEVVTKTKGVFSKICDVLFGSFFGLRKTDSSKLNEVVERLDTLTRQSIKPGTKKADTQQALTALNSLQGRLKEDNTRLTKSKLKITEIIKYIQGVQSQTPAKVGTARARTLTNQLPNTQPTPREVQISAPKRGQTQSEVHSTIYALINRGDLPQNECNFRCSFDSKGNLSVIVTMKEGSPKANPPSPIVIPKAQLAQNIKKLLGLD